MPTPARSDPDTLQSGRTQKVGPPTTAAFPVAAARALQQETAPFVLELDVVAASHSASVLAASSEGRPGVGPGAAAGRVAAVGVTAVGPGAAVPGADREFEIVPAAGDLLPAGAALAGDSTMPSDCPAPDMAARKQSGAGAAGPAALVEAEAVLAVAVALPHKRHFGQGWREDRQPDHLVEAVYTQPEHLGTCHILPGHIRLCSMHTSAAGRVVDHNQVAAVRHVGT